MDGNRPSLDLKPFKKIRPDNNGMFIMSEMRFNR